MLTLSADAGHEDEVLSIMQLKMNEKKHSRISVPMKNE